MGRLTFRVLHLFSGIGGGALGFQQAAGRWAELAGRFADLAAMTPEELRAAAGDEAPDVVFASPPCTGFSGLLPKARAAGEHYQRLNRLVLQGLFLVLETWPARPPRLILIENVPRITSRGAELLAQVEQLLAQYGYRWDRSTHDAGALGGLGQHRQRFLLLARHERQLPTLVYQPPRQRVRSIGEVLGALPLPDDPTAGPLHRLPRLQWRTWVRLALIPAGGDWRDLPAGEYVTTGDPERFKGRPGLLGVVPWDAPAGAVTGSASPTGSNGVAAVADPRTPDRFRNQMQVAAWGEPAGTVTGAAGPWQGAPSVADPRGRTVQPYNNVWRVVRWDEASGAVTAGGGPSSSGICVADPRLAHEPRGGSYRIVRWDESAPTVTGAEGIGRSCSYGVADPRLGCAPRAGGYRVQRWDEPAATVIGSADVHAGAAAVADPRLPDSRDCPDPPPIIIAEDGTWHRPLTTLELAALQGLPVRMPDGAPLTLTGRSDGRWRKAIGNMVPPPAAQAIAEQLLQTLLQAADGQVFALGATPIWVERHERAPMAAEGC